MIPPNHLLLNNDASVSQPRLPLPDEHAESSTETLTTEEIETIEDAETLLDALFNAAVHKTLTAEEAASLVELLARQPERAVQLHSMARQHQEFYNLVQQRVYPVQSDEYWSCLTERIMEHAEWTERTEHDTEYHDSFAAAAPTAKTPLPTVFQVLAQPISQTIVQMAQQKKERAQRLSISWSRSAAVLVMGIAIGVALGVWISTSAVSPDALLTFSGNPRSHRSATTQVGQPVLSYRTEHQTEYRTEPYLATSVRDIRDVQELLEQAHMLFVGVMNMNADCGVVNPQTLAAQRSACVNLLLRSQTLRQSALLHQSPQMYQLLGSIEHALAEIAAIEPATLSAGCIRRIQAHSDYALCELAQHSGARHLLDNH